MSSKTNEPLNCFSRLPYFMSITKGMPDEPFKETVDLAFNVFSDLETFKRFKISFHQS